MYMFFLLTLILGMAFGFIAILAAIMLNDE